MCAKKILFDRTADLLRRRKLAQLIVNQRQQLFSRRGIALFDRLQDPRDLAHTLKAILTFSCMTLWP